MGHVSRYQHPEWERVCESVWNYQTVSHWFSCRAGQGVCLGVEGGVSVCFWTPANGAGWWHLVACPSRGQLSEGFPLHICKYFPLVGIHHELLGEGTGLGSLCCLCMCKCHCWCCFAGSVCICMSCTPLISARVPVGVTHSTLPLARPGDMQQQQQLHPSWDAKFSKPK